MEKESTYQNPILCDAGFGSIAFVLTSKTNRHHREDGPAYIKFRYESGELGGSFTTWDQFGKPHRNPIEGPAEILFDDGTITTSYYINGRLISKDET